MPIWTDLLKEATKRKSLLQKEATEIESIDFAECYTTWLKDAIYAVTTISIEVSMHIQILISAKALKGIQQSGSIIEMLIKKFFRVLLTSHVKIFLGDEDNTHILLKIQI